MNTKMKQRLIGFIRRWPDIYRIASNLYWMFQFEHLLEILIGTRAKERKWAKRSIAEGYWANRDHPSKQFLANKIAAFSPVHSILEVGCASGPNLYVLAKKFPQASIVGIDINQEAIKYGNERFAKEKVQNVKLIVGKADGLGQFQDRSFDIIFTNALLIYIGPDKIRQVIKEMIRISHKALILMELHCFEYDTKNSSWLGIYRGGNWVRDYRALLKQFVPEEQIRVTKIPEGILPVEPWNESGVVIEVILVI